MIGHLFLRLCNIDSIVLGECKYYHDNSNKGKPPMDLEIEID